MSLQPEFYSITRKLTPESIQDLRLFHHSLWERFKSANYYKERNPDSAHVSILDAADFGRLLTRSPEGSPAKKIKGKTWRYILEDEISKTEGYDQRLSLDIVDMDIFGTNNNSALAFVIDNKTVSEQRQNIVKWVANIGNLYLLEGTRHSTVGTLLPSYNPSFLDIAKEIMPSSIEVEPTTINVVDSKLIKPNIGQYSHR